MITPPCPGLPALLLAAAAKLSWVQISTHGGRALGHLRDVNGSTFALVMVAADAPGSVNWHLVHGAAPAGFLEFSITKEAAEHLTAGHHRARLAAMFLPGGVLVAELAPEAAAS